MLDKLKILLGIPNDAKDDVLEELIEICSNEFKDITHTNVVVSSVVIQMVIYRYNRLGAEGLTNEQYSGFSNNYGEYVYSPELTKQIISHRKIRTI